MAKQAIQATFKLKSMSNVKSKRDEFVVNMQTQEQRIERMTNTEFVEDLMDGHSKYGALSQMVLVDAIRIGLQSIHGAKEHFDAKTNEAKAAGRVSIINWQAWWECSGELLDKYNNKYG